MTLRRIALIVGGYALAWGSGTIAVWWHDRGLSPADQLAMSGMLAFGDTVLFCAVAAPIAILPTILLFARLGRAPRFWWLHARGSLLLSCTGVIEAGLFLAPISKVPAGPLESLATLSPVRVLAAPIFLLAYSPGLLPVAAPNRTITLVACLLELCSLGSFIIWLMLQRV